MKIRAALLAAAVSGLLGAEAHEFKLPDGRSIEAEIMDFNAKTGIVELMLENGKRKKVKPTIVIAEDQAYIKEWASLAGVRSPSLFKVSAKKDLVKKWKETAEGNNNYPGGNVETETISETKFERYVFNIQLENRNAVALEGMTFEYRIYYDQLRAAGTGAKRAEGVVDKKIAAGELKLARLDPRKKVTLKTSAFDLHQKEYLGDFNYAGGDPIKEEGEIKGIWIKIRVKSASGKVVTRDVYSPSSLRGKYKWE